MIFSDYLALFGILIIFLGIGLLLYVNILGLLLRFHIFIYPKFHRLQLTELTQHELDNLNDLITTWERQAFGATQFSEELRQEKPIANWEFEAVAAGARAYAFGSCASELRKALFLPAKWPLQSFEQGKN